MLSSPVSRSDLVGPREPKETDHSLSRPTKKASQMGVELATRAAGRHRSSTTLKPFDSPSLFRRGGRQHARGTRGMGPEVRRAVRAWNLDLCEWIVGAA